MSTPTGSNRRVARVTIEAPIVSFRYPHFLIGRQPSFDMPPPSTVYGHIASALGGWPSFPVEFAYHFRSRSRGSDLEHQHIITRYEGKKSLFTEPDPLWSPPLEMPATGRRRPKPPEPPAIGTSVNMTVQPHLRDFLFGITWTLYLDPPELADAFRSPVFPVVLGRSQDLACIVSVETITLEAAPIGYFERTLLPISFRQRMAWGVTALMPRFIGPPPERDAEFEPFIVLHDRIYLGAAGEGINRRLLEVEGTEERTYWVDPSTEQDRGGHRALCFHRIEPGGKGHG